MENLVRRYRAGRDNAIARYLLTNQRDDRAFVEMANIFARELQELFPTYNFGQFAGMYAEAVTANDGRAHDVRPEILAMTPDDRTALQEILGCLLGLLRAGRQ